MKKTKKLLIPLAICLCSPAALAQSNTSNIPLSAIVEAPAPLHTLIGSTGDALTATQPGAFTVSIIPDGDGADMCLSFQAENGALEHEDYTAEADADTDGLYSIDLTFECSYSFESADISVINWSGGGEKLLDAGSFFYNMAISAYSCTYNSNDNNAFTDHIAGNYSDTMVVSVTDMATGC